MTRLEQHRTFACRPWVTATILGVIAIGIAMWFAGRVVPDCGQPLRAPMLEFELMLDRAGLARVLDCAPRLAELDRQNIVDLSLFIPAYTGFLVAFALAAGMRRGLAIALGFGVALGDYAETLSLRAISAAWPAFHITTIPILAIAARVKFVLIGIMMVLSALSLWRQSARAGRIVAILLAVSATGAFVTLIPGVGRLGSTMIALGWLLMLVNSATRVLFGRALTDVR